jgi:hypothetical protein
MFSIIIICFPKESPTSSHFTRDTCGAATAPLGRRLCALEAALLVQGVGQQWQGKA